MNWIVDIARHSNPSRTYQERIIENIARLAWQPVETKPSTWENIGRQACKWARETSWMTWITLSDIILITGCLVRSRRKIQIVIKNSNSRNSGAPTEEEAHQATQAQVSRNEAGELIDWAGEQTRRKARS